MLGTIFTVALITIVIMTPVVTLALCKVAKEADKVLEHPERTDIKGDK